jgi:hypothetical protein
MFCLTFYDYFSSKHATFRNCSHSVCGMFCLTFMTTSPSTQHSGIVPTVYVVCFVWHFMTTSPPSTHHSGIVPTVYVVCFVLHFMTTSPPSTHHSGIVPTVYMVFFVLHFMTTSPPSTQHSGIRTRTSWLGVVIM